MLCREIGAMRDKADVALNAAEEIYEMKKIFAGQRFGYALIESELQNKIYESPRGGNNG
jgi:hypothetical protein